MAESNLASYYYHGVGVAKNISKSISLYESAMKHGDDYAPLALGNLFEQREYKKINADKVYSYYLLSGERGYVPAVEKIISDSTLKNSCGRSQCQKTVKKEFTVFFEIIKKAIPIADTAVPQEWFNEIVAMKRSERYVQASRFYMLVCYKKECLSSNVANAWIKVLAAAGDVEDAIKLGEYVLSFTDTPRLIPMAWSNLEINTERLKSLTERKAWNELAQLIDSFSGGMGNCIRVSEIDVTSK